MNMHMGTLQQQHDNWKAARQRLWGSQKVLAQATAAKPIAQLVEALPSVEPEWKSADVYFDDHVIAWRSLISKLLLEYQLSMPNEKRPAKEIIFEVLEMFPGVNIREMKALPSFFHCLDLADRMKNCGMIAVSEDGSDHDR